MSFKERFFSAVHWLRDHPQPWIRILAGILLVVGGIFGFLPILGFWMIPLGLMLLAVDFPWAKRLLVNLKLLVRKVRMRWRRYRESNSGVSDSDQTR